jgi:hypothetical protein
VTGPATGARAAGGADPAPAAAGRVLVAALASGPAYLAMYLGQQAVHAGPGGRGQPVGVAVYLVATVVLVALYGWLLRLCRRGLPARLRLLVLGLPVLYSLLWLPTVPVFSSDVFSYIAHGYVRVGLDANPYAVDSAAVAASPIGAELASYGWRPVFPPTPYGPLVTHLETGLVRLAGGDVRLAVLLFKLAAVAASLAAAGLIRWILGMVRPRDRDLGTVAYLWNPAVLVEVAGEGHNDALMAALVLLALGLTLRRRVAVAVLAMTAAALTKYLPLLLVPLQLGYWWSGPERPRRLAGRLAMGAVAGLVVTVVLLAPFWRGTATFTGLRESGRAGHTGSTQTVVVEVLSRLVGESPALRVVAVTAAAALLFLALVLALRVPDADALLRRSALVMVVALVIAGPAYWPWYVVLPVALLALTPHGGWLLTLLAISLGSRLVAPVNSLYVDGAVDRAGFLGLTWLGAVALPLAAVLVARRADFREVLTGSLRRRYRAPDRDSGGS